MRIDKLDPFYTGKDLVALAECNKELDKILSDADTLSRDMRAAKEAGDMDAVATLIEQSKMLWDDEIIKIQTAHDEIIRSIEQRYINSFNGNISAILLDVQEIVDAVEKEEYLAHQDKLKELSKPILDNKPRKEDKPIKPSKPDKDCSEEEARNYEIALDKYKDELELYRNRVNGYNATKTIATRGYISCYYFILERIRVQLNAFSFYQSEDGEAQAIEIVEKKAASFYDKPKGAKPERSLAPRSMPITTGSEAKGALIPTPSSPVLALIMETFNGDVDHLAERKHSYNRNMKIDVSVFEGENSKNKRKVSYTTGKTTASIEIDDFTKLTSRNPQAKKILVRILQKACEQAIHDGKLTRDRVAFPLRELVGDGQYKNMDTARLGYYNATDILTSYKVSGKIEKGKTIQQGKHAVLFKAAVVNKATCEIYLNDMFEWGLIAAYFYGLPDYYYELPDRAAELLEYIFYLGRQNAKSIEEKGYFDISYRAIQGRLNLPNEDSIKNTKRDIKDAIELAIEQIEEKYCKYAPPIPKDATGEAAIPDFSLLPLANYDDPIKKYLNEGRLRVSLKGEYARNFIAIAREANKKIEAAKKRQDRIVDRAKAINLAKNLETNQTQ